MKTKIYLHIGYPKTATSAMQKHVFPEIKGLNYLGKNENAKFKFENKLLEGVLYNASTMEHSLFRKQVIREDLFQGFDGELFLSEEVLLFNIFRPTLWQSKTLCIQDIVRNLKLLETTCDVEFHIIISIRKQLEMLTSIYAQCFNSCYSRLDETQSFESFLDYFFKCSQFYNALNYDYVFSKFNEAFEKVEIMVYEELKYNKKLFLSSLGEHMGVIIDIGEIERDNVRNTGSYKKVDDFSLSDLLGRMRHKIYFLRNIKFPRLRKAFHKVKLKKMADVSTTIVINDDKKNFIVGFYKDSNKSLEYKYNIDLTRYGYFK
ncbi:hypothetical protein [Shewanella metallivivens]|uniref:Sulfotransferase domain-containing protein n=1 Tax=Shewanella metallivivens TaxID=2872342 RepID=A0ABT5TJK9_9GAMM|nr:hypothetical protein [Shewanella metallivivens]MDD8057631.1 hypothetical protein [Shewanella metallivivens]